MKIRTLIETQTIDKPTFDVRAALYEIEKNCKPYLKLNSLTFSDVQRKKNKVTKKMEIVGMCNFEHIPLYRGMRNVNVDFGTKQVKQNRPPRGTHPHIHALFGQYFKDKFGINFRSDAFFTTGSVDQTWFYGDLFVVFPKGNFNFCYSNRMRDLYDVAIELSKPYYELGETEKETNQLIQQNITPDKVNQRLDKLNYKMNDNLKYAIQTKLEIMIECKEYYFVSVAGWKAIRAELAKRSGLTRWQINWGESGHVEF